jgi:hypothetical protein
MSQCYVTWQEANDYFAERLHSPAWGLSSRQEQEQSLLRATRDIDNLNYKGDKHTVYLITNGVLDVSTIDPASIRAANIAQELEFPRDSDTTVPPPIKRACYEIAYSLLDEIDPDLELENLAVTSQGYAGVRTTYNRMQQPIEHYIAGIASAAAWRILRPFLRDGKIVKFSRV